MNRSLLVPQISTWKNISKLSTREKQSKWLSEIEFNDQRDSRVFTTSQKAKIKPNVFVFLLVFVSPTHYDIAGERRQREGGKEKQKSICNIKHKHFLFDGIASLAVIYASCLPFDSRVMRSGFLLSRTLKDIAWCRGLSCFRNRSWAYMNINHRAVYIRTCVVRLNEAAWPGILSNAEWHTLFVDYQRSSIAFTSWPT